MKHVFIICAHAYPGQLKKLLMHLDAPDHVMVVHVDKKSNIADFLIESDLPKGGRVIFLRGEDRIKCFHSGFSQVRCTLNLLKKAMELAPDYIHFISGQDYPCRSMSEFDDFFVHNAPRSFMEFDSEELASQRRKYDYPVRYRYFHLMDFQGSKSRYPKHIWILNGLLSKFKIRGEISGYAAGCNWFSWHHILAERVLKYVKDNPSYVKRFRHTVASDEYFFHTMINRWNDDTNIFLDRNNSLRYIDWQPKRPYEGSLPLTLNELDYDSIVASDRFFCRKIHPVISTKLIDKLDERL